jgi:patatin-like phospholipase/acyl hydrolase
MKILTGDGGGIFGIIPATLLKDKRVFDSFDAFGGTSISSVLMAWYSLGNDPSVLPEKMSEMFMKVFHRSLFTWHRLPFGPKWPDTELVKFAKANFDMPMSDVKKPLYIISFDFANRVPKVFSSIKDPDVRIYEAILASVSAPTYFAPYKNYIDGGVWANNPSVVTATKACNEIIRARSLDKTRNNFIEDVELFSIGTGRYNKPPFDMTYSKYWGALSWASRLIPTMLVGSSETGWDMVAKELPFKKYVRYNDIQIDDDWEMDDVNIIKDGSLTRAAEMAMNSFNTVWNEFHSTQ